VDPIDKIWVLKEIVSQMYFKLENRKINNMLYFLSILYSLIFSVLYNVILKTIEIHMMQNLCAFHFLTVQFCCPYSLPQRISLFTGGKRLLQF
jgi:uncharacterized membrane protein YagU involved in acid resistance